jgi:hypothetical protein
VTELREVFSIPVSGVEVRCSIIGRKQDKRS